MTVRPLESNKRPTQGENRVHIAGDGPNREVFPVVDKTCASDPRLLIVDYSKHDGEAEGFANLLRLFA